MTDNLIKVRAVVLTVLFLLASVLWFPVISFSSTEEEYLTVRFLDVGQGDAIHVETPDGYELLIDGGATSAVLSELAKDRNFFDRYIDMIMVTHPDTDHIGGLVDVLQRYEVGAVVQGQVSQDNKSAQAFASATSEEGADTISAKAGQVIKLGASTTIEVLSPQGDTGNWKSNNASIVVQVTYGDIEFMLTGDAPSSIEDYLVGIYGADLESEVLKLGHHGSKTSTSELFLDTINPDFAIVSAGDDNRYGHPHQSVMSRVFKRKIKTLSTATEGTIVFRSDGKEVWVE